MIEGSASALDLGRFPIELRAIGPAAAPSGGLGGAALRAERGAIVDFLVFLAYVGWHFCRFAVKPVRVMTRGDLYHLHSYEYFPVVWLWSRLFGGRILYDAHDFYPGLYRDADLPRVRRRWIRPFLARMEALCVARADTILTVNDGIADLIEARFGRRPEILRNAHDERLDRAPDRTIRETLGLADDRFLVVIVGNRKVGRAVEEAIEALRLLPERVHLACVGAGYDDLAETAARRGLAGRVHGLPPVAPDEIVPFIAAADASLVAYSASSDNFANSLPNGFFQAVAARLPLVFPPLKEIAGLAKRYGCGVEADPRSPVSVAAALRRLAEDEAERRRCRAGAAALATAISFAREERVLRAALERGQPLAASA